MTTHAPWEPAFAGAAAALQQLLKALQGEEVQDWEVVVASAERKAEQSQESSVSVVTSKHAGQSGILRRTGVTLTASTTNVRAEQQERSSQKPASVHYQEKQQSSAAADFERSSSRAYEGTGVRHSPGAAKGKPASHLGELEQTLRHPTGPGAGEWDQLRLQLTGLLQQDSSNLTSSVQAPAVGRSRNFASMTPMTAMTTARTDVSESDALIQAKAGGIVDDIVQTCADLEQAMATASTTGSLPQLTSSTAVSSALPSARWSARAAEAAVVSARAAESAAAQAAAASALAAKEAARAAAAAKAASGCYNGFVDWLVLDPPRKQEALPLGSSSASVSTRPHQSSSKDVEDDSSESEDDPNEGISQHSLVKAKENVQLPDIDLNARIGLKEWRLILQELDLDPDEGGEIFQRICATAAPQHREEESYPVGEFLVELHIEEDDAEGLQSFATALQKAKQEAALGHQAKRVATNKRSAARTLFDKVLRELSSSGCHADRAWELVASGQVKLSKAEQGIIESSWQDKQAEFLRQAREYLIQPPVVNATAGQVVCAQRCCALVEDIVKTHKAAGTQFTDPDWDMTQMPAFVLYVDKERPGYDCTVGVPAGYKRLTEIVKDSASGGLGDIRASGLGSLFGGSKLAKSEPKEEMKPVVFKDGVGAGDIVQGQIGTCFLLGAIGAIAGHNSKAIKHLFLSYDVDVGVYGIRLNNNGEWVHVIVDDWFPVDENGELLYSRCRDPQEVWIPLLEKAFCKLHTCFEMCDGGKPSEAVASFFGGVSGHFNIKRAHRKHPDRYYTLLKQARDRGWLLTTGFQQQAGKQVEGSGKCGEGMLANGLIAGHAYAVLRVAEAEGQCLVCCLNPWGTGEWTGKWSDRNEYGEWTPSMKKAVNYHKADDGRFWMSIEDFVECSSGVDYARTFGPNWQKISHYKRFASKRMIGAAKRDCNGRRSDQISFSKGDSIEIYECSSEWWRGKVVGTEAEGYFRGAFVEVKDKPVMRFDLVGTVDKEHESMKVVLMLMQPNSCMQRRFRTRSEDGLNYKDTKYGHLQFIVIGPDGNVAFKREGKKRCVWGELDLPGGGLWKVYALSVDGHGGQCTIRAYLKNGTAVLKEVTGATFSEVKGLLL